MKYNTLYRHPNERLSVTYPFVWWDGAFTPEECDNIVEYCDSMGTDKAMVLGADTEEKTYTNEKVRVCGIKFHVPNDDNKHIFLKLNQVITNVNDQFYGFDLNGYSNFQYTSYDGSVKAHYDWHMDLCMGKELPPTMIEPRKLSFSLVLNDDYEGGAFRFNTGGHRGQTAEQKKGRVIAFPSYVLHKVEPVTKGFRKSIVVWVTGPKFV